MSYVPIDSICTASEPKPDWLIPDTIYKGSQIILAALAGVGKSVFCYALGNALASGSEFLGAVLPPFRVLYFDEENSIPDLSAYARWTWRGLGEPNVKLLRENFRIESMTLRSATNWGHTLRGHCAAFRPDLIIFDTATPAFRILDENDNGEANRASGEVRLAQAASGPQCAAIILKHLRKDHQSGQIDIRGAKAWRGAVDAIWYHLSRPGRRRPDGWRNTYIRPDKSRAYGLRDTLAIHPEFEPSSFVKLNVERIKGLVEEEQPSL